jgi:uncharacterized protein (TIGR02145 family)
MPKYLKDFIVSISALLFVVAGLIIAGEITNINAPAPTFYTLEDIYNLIHNNSAATEGNHSLTASSEPIATSSYSVSQIYADLANLIKREDLETGVTYLGVTGDYNNPDSSRATTTVLHSSLTPTTPSPQATGYTLEDIYNLIHSNTIATTTKAFPPTGTPASTMHTISEIYTDLVNLAITKASMIKSGVSYLGQAGSYLSPLSFSCGGALVDARDSKSYATVQIGQQCWMKQNLNIGTRTDGINAQGTSTVSIFKYCYNDLDANCASGGGLYQWNQLMGGSTTTSIRGICPDGWHVPGDNEYKTLEKYLGMTQFQADDSGTPRGANQEGNKLKKFEFCSSGGTSCGTSGFDALLSGGRAGGSYSASGTLTTFWTSLYRNSSMSWLRRLSIGWNNVYRDYEPVASAYSVRCLNDETLTSAPSVPFIGTATAGPEEATVTFTAPLIDGGSPILDYTVTSSSTGAVVTATGASSPIIITGLTDGTNYTFTVTARNSIGTSSPSAVSNSVTPTAPPSWSCGDPYTDIRDSNVYNTVQIGTQCWMQQNMNIGTMVTGTTSPQGTNCSSASAINKYCYNNNVLNCNRSVNSNTDGALYQWDQAMCGAASCNGTDQSQPACSTPVKGICPTGWHIPSHYEFTALLQFICTSGTCATDFPYDEITTGDRGTDEGKTLKSTSTPDLFSGLLAGARYVAGSFSNNGVSTHFWSSLQSGTSAWDHYLNLNFDTVRVNFNDKLSGYSVRCVNDGLFTSIPSVPTSANAVAGNGQVTVTYTAPVSNGGSPILDYTVTSNPGNISTTTSNSTTAIVTGLSTSTAYTFTVTARNGIGDSSPSNPTTPAIIPNVAFSVPSAPTAVMATSTDGEVTVTYDTPVSNGGSPILDYTITSNPDNISVTTADATTTAVVTGLTDGTNYTFIVTARNSIGNSTSSSASNSVRAASLPVSGLVSYFSFDDAASSTAIDSFGHFDATVNGATPAVGIKGLPNTAYSFNGASTSSIDFAAGTINGLKSSQTGSWCLWIYGNTLLVNRKVMMIGVAEADSYVQLEYDSDIGLHTQSRNAAGQKVYNLSVDSTPSADQYHFVCVVHDTVGTSTASSIYVDGTKPAQTFLPEGDITNPDPSIWLGDIPAINKGQLGCSNKANEGCIDWFAGSVDDVRLYDRALTGTEIADIYYLTKP